jgi:hypothetical protein
MAHVVLGEIQAAAQELLSLTPAAQDVAVFKRHLSEGRLQCAVIVYFSPAAAALAMRFGASPCRRPSRDGLALYVGDEAAWDLVDRKSEQS